MGQGPEEAGGALLFAVPPAAGGTAKSRGGEGPPKVFGNETRRNEVSGIVCFQFQLNL